MIRTCDLLIRSQALYPAELRVHKGEQIDYISEDAYVKNATSLSSEIAGPGP